MATKIKRGQYTAVITSIGNRFPDYAEWGRLVKKNFTKTLKDIPKKTYDHLPRNINKVIGSKIRDYFKINYMNKEDWAITDFSRNGRIRKNQQFKRGDTFKIGQLGKHKIIHDASVYGRRTDTTLNFISSEKGSEIKVKTDYSKMSGKRAFSVLYEIRLKDSSFRGGTIRYSSGKGRGVKENRNQLLAFNKNISGSENVPSVLVSLNKEQTSSMRSFFYTEYGTYVRDVAIAELRRNNLVK